MSLFGMISTKSSVNYTAVALRTFFAKTPFLSTDRFVLIDNDQTLENSFVGNYPVEILRNKEPKSFSQNGNTLLNLAKEMQASLFFMNNDVAFTDHWIDPLLEEDSAIISPLSNREVQYGASVVVVKSRHVANTFITTMPMSLEIYEENQATIGAIVEAHRKISRDFWRMYVMPFFCIKIPLKVQLGVGLFDESFGQAGGEDYDYCLRAYLSDYEVKVALSSYVIHFGGKSTWSGAETKEEQLSREKVFFERFREKWGGALYNLILKEQDDVLENLPGDRSGNTRESLKGNIEHLMKIKLLGS